MSHPISGESEWAARAEAALSARARLEFSTAADEYHIAVELAERFCLGDERLAESLEGLAVSRAHSRQPVDANVYPLLQRAARLRNQLLAECEASLGTEHLEVAKHLDACAFNQLWQDKPSEAIAFHQRALEFRKNALGEEHYDVAKTLDRMARVYSDYERNKEAAAELWHRAVAILERLPENPETRIERVSDLLRVTLEQLVLNAYEQEDYAAAEALFRRIVQVTADEFGSTCLAPIYAKVLTRRHRFDEAESLLNAAARIAIPHAAWRKACQEAVIELYNATGRQDEAESLQEGSSSFDDD